LSKGTSDAHDNPVIALDDDGRIWIFSTSHGRGRPSFVHRSSRPFDVDAFEREALAELGLPGEIVMRHRSPHFTHAFSGEGYSAGYYSYDWAEVLVADAAEAFAEAPGGFYDPEVAALMVEHLYAVRNAVDPADAYRAFRGRDATVDALMRARGFPVTPE
jgi:peptidyl-dipeptidase Dcp